MARCCNPRGCDRFFGPRFARRMANRYRKRGLDKAARQMVEFLEERGIEGSTVLEIGGGIGEIQIELLKRGARRSMLDEIGGFDPGYRMYCEDIDLNYRAAKAGWERWYVPAAVVRHEYAAVIDRRFLTRHTIWHARAMLRFLRKHPERLLALR